MMPSLYGQTPATPHLLVALLA